MAQFEEREAVVELFGFSFPDDPSENDSPRPMYFSATCWSWVWRVFQAVVGILVVVYCSGCTVSGIDFFPPQNSITVTNNTTVPVDVECGGQSVAPNLQPGQSYTFRVWNFVAGGQINLRAKARVDMGGTNLFVGMASKTMYLSTGYHGYGHHFEDWVIDGFDPPTSATGSKGGYAPWPSQPIYRKTANGKPAENSQ